MKKLLLLGLLLVSTLGFSQTPIPNYYSLDGLVGYWGFNNNTNDGLAVSNGEIFGNPTFTTDRFGNPNSALEFKSSSIIGSHVEMPLGRTFDKTKPITIISWVKPTTTVNFKPNSNTCIGGVSVNLANTNQNWAMTPYQLLNDFGIGGLSIGTNGLMLAKHSGNILDVVLGIEKPINDFIQVVQVYDGTKASLYVNGELIKSETNNCGNKYLLGSTICIGGYLYSNNFSGIIDDYVLYNRALDYNEIKDIYNQVPQNNLANEDFNLKGLSLYPNPTKDIINFNTDTNKQLILFDMLGKQIMSKDITNALDISTLDNGIYLATIIEGEKSTTQKIVKI